MKKKDSPYICNISNEEYHRHEGVSSSGVHLLLKSPYKYWNKYLNPLAVPVEKTEAMILGERLHALLLEEKEFYEHYLIKPKIRCDKRSIPWQAYLEEANGREIIFDEEFTELTAMRDAVMKHPIAKSLFIQGKAEKSIFWTDETTGVLCKARPDFFNETYIIDVKTTRNVSEIEFQKSMVTYGYHRQAAVYKDGIKALTGKAPEFFAFVCIEKEAPFIVKPYLIKEISINTGRMEYLSALNIYKKCKETNHWPTGHEDLVEIGLPKWYVVNISGMEEEKDESSNNN